MPRRIRPLINNLYYHVFNRGVNRQPIFSDRIDYIRITNLARYYKIENPPIRFSKFLILSNDQRKTIWNKQIFEKSLVDIISYCFIPNHFHFLLRQNEENGISKFMSDFQNSYVRYFNTRTQRIGPLFQGQFKAVRVESDEQLLHLSRYIHLNPYSSAIIKSDENLEDYEWSSYPEYLGQGKFDFCKKDIILNNFKNIESYKEYVLNNAEYQKELNRIKHLIIE